MHTLAQRVPQPAQVPYKDGFVFRHVEKSLLQALVQKLARLVSSLHAARLLMDHGFVQEQAALQRTLDELQEDVTFLAFAIIFNCREQLHEDYLAAFYQEEFDADTALASTQKRPMLPRKKIQAWIARTEGAALDPSRGIELSRTISKAYSGYIHAASPHIMDLFGGDPPRFHMTGMRGTPRHDEHRADLWNYFYRGIIAFGFVAKAFGDSALFDKIYNFSREFAERSGKNYESREWET